MTTNIIDGKEIANSILNKLSNKIKYLKISHNIVPSLIVILVGENPASQLYVRNKQNKAEFLGIKSETMFLPDTISQQELLSKIRLLNEDKNVNGILVQLPLPEYIDKNLIINAIDPKKDVDGFHNENMGKLVTDQKDCMIPCTPQGCVHLIKTVESNLSGSNVVIIGRSNIVGKPLFHLLLKENCTVTVLHSASRDLPAHTSKADIVISAVGKINLVTESWIKLGAIVIDVGINPVPISNGKNRFVGDIDFIGVQKIARAITPVPGGVGPMTIAYLMINTVIATCRQNSTEESW